MPIIKLNSRMYLLARVWAVRISAAIALLAIGACTVTRPIEEMPELAVTAQPPLSDSEHVMWGPSSCDGRLRDLSYFVICHAGDRRIPHWVVYHLSASDLPGVVSRRDHFRADPELPEDERSELADYRGSEMSRGHMAPADDFLRNFEAMDATFLLSNMAPQLQGLNGGRWRMLESEVQYLAAAHGSIWVITGPLFLDASLQPISPEHFIGNGRVAVPTHFFKAILCEHPNGEHEMFAFLVPHENGLPGPSILYAVSVDLLEELTKLDFFAPLPDPEEDYLEHTDTTIWPVQ